MMPGMFPGQPFGGLCASQASLRHVLTPPCRTADAADATDATDGLNAASHHAASSYDANAPGNLAFFTLHFESPLCSSAHAGPTDDARNTAAGPGSTTHGSRATRAAATGQCGRVDDVNVTDFYKIRVVHLHESFALYRKHTRHHQ